jgi:hypothetical protein
MRLVPDLLSAAWFSVRTSSSSRESLWVIRPATGAGLMYHLYYCFSVCFLTFCSVFFRNSKLARKQGSLFGSQILLKESLKMRKLVAVGILIFGLCLAAAAVDDAPTAEVFGGLSFLHIDDNGLHAPKRNFAGWDAEGQFNITKLLGVTADIGGNYGRVASSFPNSHSYTYAFGPTFSFRREHATMFAHVLFGENTISKNVITGGSNPSPTDGAFAMIWGGGIDVKISHAFALRLGQLDWIYTRHDLTAIGGRDNQNNIRYSGGVVINLGGH